MNRIAGLRKADRDTLYACGCLLQNLEESVLHWLLTAEMDGKKVLRG